LRGGQCSVLLLGFLALLLGVKHSYDPDHLVAVSNLLTKTSSLRQTTKMSVSWALGHMLTATIVTVVLYYFRESFLSAILGRFESVVAIMLIVLGVFAFKDIGTLHKHTHTHGGERHVHRHSHLRGAKEEHYHRHMFGIGIVHGLASNDELLVLFTVSFSLTSLFGILVGVAIFSVGVILGMVLYGMIFNYPRVRFGGDRLRQFVNIGAGTLSVAYGAALLLGIA